MPVPESQILLPPTSGFHFCYAVTCVLVNCCRTLLTAGPLPSASQRPGKAKQPATTTHAILSSLVCT